MHFVLWALNLALVGVPPVVILAFGTLVAGEAQLPQGLGRIELVGVGSELCDGKGD